MAASYIDSYEHIAPSLIGQSLDWLNQLRTKAFNQFSTIGFPRLTDEEWRYTKLSALDKTLFLPQAIPTTIDAALLERYQLDDAYCMVFINGHYSAQHSLLADLAENICVLTMAEALNQQPDMLKHYLATAVSDTEHGLVAFNTAWFDDGLFVHISAKTVLEKPIQCLHIVTDETCLSTLRNIFIADELAEVSIVETFIGVDKVYFNNTVSEVFVAQNARLDLYKMQNEGSKATHFSGTYVKQARDSRFNHHNFNFGGLLSRHDVHTDLDIASECELNGLSLGVKTQHFDNHTRINHLKPHGISRELYKSVLNQRAKSVFQGLVYVAEQAQKTDSMMNGRNLLLSNDAEADAKPQLEIYADDVKCAHGVTVGQLDESSIFYLQSRCIDEDTAKNMLTFAFANEMVEKIPLDTLRELLLKQVLVCFPQQGLSID